MTYVELGHGSLSRAKEQRNERGPSHIGSLTFKEDIAAGSKVYLSAWVKTGQDGGQYFSIQVQEPRQPSGPPRTEGYTPREPAFGSQRGRREMDDDIPF